MTTNRKRPLECDVVVIGAGVIGSSAAHYLAEKGKDVILVEQFPLPTSRGSSAGHTRITRQANYGNPALTPIMMDSYDRWLRLQTQTGLTLFRSAPLLTVGYKSSPELLQRMAASVEEAGFQPQFLNITNVNNKFRTNFPSTCEAIVDPGAGVLMADKCINAFLKLFTENRGYLLDSWPVSSIIPGKNIEVKGPRGTIIAKSIVICAGPWMESLLSPLGINLPLRVEKIGVYYWKIIDPETPKFTFIDSSCVKNHFYALPDFEYPGCMKLCLHSGPSTDPNERDKADMSKVKAWAVGYVEKNFPCLLPTPVIEESCMYTMTPDEHFFLDRHPQHKNVLMAGGFSGTGFKIAPACGAALASLASDEEPSLDFSQFSIKRFLCRSNL